MGVTFVSVGALAGSTSGVTPALPAGFAADDILVLHIEGEGEDANADGQGDFGGTLIASVVSDQNGVAFDTRNTLYWKRSTGSESAPTTDDAGNHTLACISAWRGCVTTGSPIDVFQTSSAGGGGPDRDTDVTATGVTTTVANAMIVIAHTSGDETLISGWTNANLASITEAFDASSPAGSNGAIHCAYGILVAASASGNTTATLEKSEMDANVVFAFKPVVAGGATPKGPFGLPLHGPFGGPI